MIDEDILKLIKPVIDCFADLNISYHIGGSIASSAYGFPRITADVDLGTEITLDHVRPLVKRLEKNYFIQESAIRDAITERRSFNIIHLETMFKIDVFVSRCIRIERTSF